MAGWTIRNLREVEDLAPGFGLSRDGPVAVRTAGARLRAARRQPVPARAGRPPAVWAPPRRAGGGLRRARRLRASQARRRVAELRPLDAVRVAAGTVRCFEAGPAGLEYLAVGSPGGANDVETIQSWWSD